MKKSLNGIKIARISTAPFFVVTQLSEQLKDISEAGAQLTVITSEFEPLGDNLVSNDLYSHNPLTIYREINLLADFKALIKLIKIFRSEKFDIVHSTTPKAGLLVSIAGLFAGTKVRIHTFTGQTWVHKQGVMRYLLKALDSLIIRINTISFVDSHSQKLYLSEQNVCKESQLHVLGAGSLAGVNLQRFSDQNFVKNELQTKRQALNIPEQCKVILFLGRVTKDKGVCELLEAFKAVELSCNDIFLLIVGPLDNDFSVDGIEFEEAISSSDNIRYLGYQKSPEIFFQLADLLCLPSYREGFGTAVLEAAASGLPCVGSNIYGLSDAIVNGETGLLVEAKNPQSLALALEKLLKDQVLLDYMGAKAAQRAKVLFDSKKISQKLISEYLRLLNAKRKQLKI